MYSGDNMTSKEKARARYRNFCFLIYPDSAPKNFIEILEDVHVPMCISPLHDKDTQPDGTPKKPHYHVLIMYDGVHTYDQFREVADLVNGVYPKAEDLKNPDMVYNFFYRKQWVVSDVGGYARYLCHLDNDDKAKYSVEDVKSLNGADYYNIVTVTSDKYACISQMIEFIDAHGITDYVDIMNYARDNNFMWFRVLCDCGSYVIINYCKSNKYKLAKLMQEAVKGGQIQN